MPWTNLPTNFRNLIWSGLKKFRRYDNPDNTVSFEDATEYTDTANTQLSAEQLNQMTGAVNDLMNGVVVYLKAAADARTYEICETVNEKPLLAEYYITGHTYEIGDVLIKDNLLQRITEELLPSRFELLDVHELTNNGSAKAGDYYSYGDHLFVFNTDTSWSGSSSADYYYNEFLNHNAISIVTYVLYDPEESYTNQYIYYNGRFYHYDYDGGNDPQYAFEPVVVAYLISELQEQIDNINNFAIHICVSGEYDPLTYVPTIQNPQANTFYFVPTNGGQNDLFAEWIYVSNHWEKFGLATVDLSGYYTKTEADALLADKADTDDVYTKTETDALLFDKADASDLGALAGKNKADWDTDIDNIPSTFPPSTHNHDDLYYSESEINTLLANKQNILTFDNAPTANSNNPVKSSGIYTALGNKQDSLTFDDTPTQSSNNPVKSGGVYSALADKANTSDLGTLAGKNKADWDTDIDDIPSTFPPSTHNHDERYYTKTEVGTLLRWVDETVVAFHNSVPRGKDITSYLTDGSLWDRIKGTNGYDLFEDLYLGDYITAGGQDYMIVDFDYYIRTGDSHDLNVHHLVMMPVGRMSIPSGTVLYNTDATATPVTLEYINTANYRAYTGDDTVSVSSQETDVVKKWNATIADPNTNTTAGGYKYSRMRQVVMKAADTIVRTAFGADHVKAIDVIYPNPADASASGTPSSWAWFKSTAWTADDRMSLCDLPNELQIYGQYVWGNRAYEIGIDKWQFSLFRYDRSKVNIRANWWLRSVSSATHAAYVSAAGFANSGGSSNAYGVRPRFLLVG
jgi:hypothetical protein